MRCVQRTALSLSVSPRNSQRWKKSEAQNFWNDIRSRTSSQQIWERSFYLRDDLKVKSISVSAANHVEVITPELPDVVIHSVYKPPSEQFVFPPLGHRILPQIVIGDFNSHKTIWGSRYRSPRCISCTMDRVEQPNTHPRCETTEIFQQCKMEERLQPIPHFCIFQLW